MRMLSLLTATAAMIAGVVAANAAGPDPAAWQKSVDSAIGYLKSSQEVGGSWSATRSPGVTGVVVTGILHSGRVKPDETPVARGLAYIESLINEKAGHIAGADPRPQLLNYVTSINV